MDGCPKVSILAACYNHENYIADFLESVLAQNYDNIELIVCDDCSKDRSFERMNEYKERLEARFQSVQLLRNPENMGVTKNFNGMLEKSTGDIIKIVASDDMFQKDAVKEVVRCFSEHPEVDAVVTNGHVVAEESTLENQIRDGLIYPEAPDFEPSGLFERTFKCNMISAPCAFLRRTVFEKHGDYDASFAIEDFEFWLRVTRLQDTRFYFLNENLMCYRKNADSITSMTNNEKLAQRRLFFHKEQLKIMEKYRPYVNPMVFAETVIDNDIRELYFAKNCGLKQYYDEIEKELKDFDCWKDAGSGFQIKSKLRMYKCKWVK